MTTRHSAGWALLLITFSGGCVLADTVCDDQLVTSLRQCERVVGSLRYDKLSQARVFASDGSVYTAGQAQWMKGQLQLVEQECAHGDTAAAARDLAEVEAILKAHHSSIS